MSATTAVDMERLHASRDEVRGAMLAAAASFVSAVEELIETDAAIVEQLRHAGEDPPELPSAWRVLRAALKRLDETR